MSEEKRMIPEEYAKRALEEQREYYEDKLKEKPNAIQIIAFGVSCFSLGFSLAKLFI